MSLTNRISLTVDRLNNPNFGVAMAPKCGSTSVDKWVVERNGFDKCKWATYSTALAFGLRSWVDTCSIDFPIYAITRDPVDRMRSVIANRIYSPGPKGIRSRVSSDWSPDDIIERLEDFRFLCTDFFWHTRPQVDFIGSIYTRFKKVVDISELSLLMRELTGETVGYHNVSYSISIEFSEASVAKIKQFYAADYEFIESAGSFDRLKRFCFA